MNAVTVEAALLKDATAWVSRVIPPRPAVPLLAAISIDVADGVMSLAAFNFETYAAVGVPADGAWEDRVFVHGRVLADVAGRLTGAVTLTLQDGEVLVQSGRTAVRVRTMDGTDYPAVPAPAPTVGTVDAATFTDLTHQAAAVAASQAEQSLSFLACLHLAAGDGTLTVQATDRYRAAIITTGWDGDPFTALVNATVFTSALKGITGTITLGVDEHHVTVTGGGRTFTMTQTLIAGGGDYPDLAHLVPDSTDFVTVDRAALLDAIGTARLAVDVKGTPIRVTVADSTVTVEGGSDRSQAQVVLDADHTADIGWGFNAEFLQGLVNATDGPRVEFGMGTGNHPAKPVRVVGVDPDGDTVDDAVFVIVPIRSVP